MKKYDLIREYLKLHSHDLVIFDLASKMFEEGSEDPVFILSHVIIYQHNLLKTKDSVIKPLIEAA